MFERINKGYKLLFNDIKNIRYGIIALIIYKAITIVLDIQFCPLRNILGLPCPTCGLTRSFKLFFTGHFYEAIIMHPLILSIIVLSVAFFLFRYVLFIDYKNLKYLLIFTLIVCFGVYIYRIITVFPDKSPMIYEEKNILRIILTLFS